MFKLSLSLVAAALTASCTPSLKVEVANRSQTERDDETVEIAWSELAPLQGVTPANIIVLDDDGEQVPSQVVYFGQTEPKSLIFQADVEAMKTEHFKITTGTRKNYPVEAYGRQVPERHDDYAWENNKVVYRIYGAALETSPEQLLSPAIDIWVKSTDQLVIDDWYAKADYHHNDGEGMDCYKAGTTLGGGASLPFSGGKFWSMEHNYAAYQTLDNGPIRTTVRLSYGPFLVDSIEVSYTKIISLDANQRFNRIDNIYQGAFSQMPIAAGFARHDVRQYSAGNGWFAIREAASDSKDPVRDGDIYVGLVLPGAAILADTLGHALAVKSVRPGQTMTYYAGSGWSQGGVDDMDEWIETVAEQEAAATMPLQVTVRK